MSDDEARKSRMTMYAQMVNTPGWQDLEKWANGDCERSMKSIDAVSIEDMNLARVAEERGYRKGLRKIFEQAEYVKAQG